MTTDRPDSSPLRAALLGCAVTTGAGAVFNCCDVTPGETVAVVGCGGIGLAAINDTGGRVSKFKNKYAGLGF